MERIFVILFVCFALVFPLCEAGYACLDDPCINGICIDDLNSTYDCFCINGFTGLQCQVNWNECWSFPCLNGGTCVDGIATYNCTCPEGFSGALCESDLHACDSDPCWNNGTCAIEADGFTCQCMPGYTGSLCDVDISVCNSSTPNGLDAQCLNGGFCIDGPGNTFVCICTPGWTGRRCQEQVNECLSQPCHNGAVCVDRFGDYACACALGYTGKNCETKLQTCASNPCQNGAFCLVENGDFVCYCVPDFHGHFCEMQYDDCLPGPRCMNGGTCIDGIANFTCSCPVNVSGKYCECTDTEFGKRCEEVPGVFNETFSTVPIFLSSSEVTTQWTLPFSSPAITIATTSSMVATTTVYDPGGSLSWDSVSSSETVDLESSFSIMPSEPLSSVHYEPSTTATLPAGDWSWIVASTAEVVSSGDFEMPSTTVVTQSSFSPPSSWWWWSESSYTATYRTSVLPEESSWSQFSSLITLISTQPEVEPTVSSSVSASDWSSVLFSSPVEETPSFSSSIVVTEITPVVTEANTTLSETTEVTIPTTTETTVQTLENMTTTETITPPLENMTTTETISPPLENTTITESTVPTSENITITESTVPNVTTAESTSTVHETTATSIEISNETTTVSMTTEDSTTELMTTKTEATTTPSKENVTGETEVTTMTTTEVTTQESVSTSPTTTEEPIPSINTSSTAIITTSTTSTSSTTTSTTMTPVQNVTEPFCSPDLCQNNGVCVLEDAEPKCLCTIHYEGPTCRDEVHISHPAFSGSSYLTHVFPNMSFPGEMEVSLTLRTLISSGLIFLIGEEDQVYMVLYLQGGYVKFIFSCGMQSMMFTETMHNVNNGYPLRIRAKLQFFLVMSNERKNKCASSLHVNESYVMKGEQEATRLPSNPHLHVGGLPKNVPCPVDAHYLSGFEGCIEDIEINGEGHHIFEEAVSGADVEECQSLACVSRPCINDGKCMVQGSSWYCQCKPGYSGLHCERALCKMNQCMYGGTCVNTENKAEFLCLCPYGRGGRWCEKAINITKTSFGPSTSGYSSYLTSAVPAHLERSMTIRFHFSTFDFEQIALMLFVGQEGLHEANSDYFSISFIKGYIVVTWNLGSGPRRIFTPQPVASYKREHTVFVGLVGRRAWLKVDQLRNITGKSPGKLSALNVASDLYIGGHESYGFNTLPHDLPLHLGFMGCIYDVSIASGSQLMYPLQVTGGVNVHDCDKQACDEGGCQNGGTCVDYGAAFQCICPSGWYGPLCSEPTNPCYTGIHRCPADSICSAIGAKYTCNCPLGKMGKLCEKKVNISSTMSFLGHSYLFHHKRILSNNEGNDGIALHVSLRFRTHNNDGLLFWMGKSSPYNTAYLGLAIHNNSVNLVLGRRSKNRSLLASNSPSDGFWHLVAVEYNSTHVSLTVDKDQVEAHFATPMVWFDPWVTYYIGGLPRPLVIPEVMGTFFARGFQGCIKDIFIDVLGNILTTSDFDGFNIQPCSEP